MSARITVLYIEDDKASQRLVKRVLEGHGYEVFTADDGLRGIAIARQEKPQLILIDINLPTMDGQEITTRLRSLPHFATTPIVAVTANASPNSRQQALAAGCSGFITKPIDVLEFPKSIASYLEGQIEPLPDGERSHHLELYAQRLVERLESKLFELQTANQQLRELDRMKSDFIVLVSHELRTPLTLISGYAYLLREKADRFEGTDDFGKSVGEIAGGLAMGVERLSQVVNEIITVSRIASGALDLAIGPTRLSVMIAKIVDELADTCRGRGLELDIGGLDDVPMIEADGVQLRIALGNVVNNAVKYTPDGGRVSIFARTIGDAIDIVVQDTGVGIDPEKQRLIFEQFHVLGPMQHHSTSKSAFQGGGLGLGLPIAKGIIEAHHGRIWVESEGRHPSRQPGSTFHILLPIKQT